MSTLEPIPQVDDAVDFINRKIILSGLELAREVGEYILDTFFDGDYKSFADPSRSKDNSFRALLDREDLILGHATLYRLVRISHQLRMLPIDLSERLSLTHHQALLPLPDPAAKETLARQALDEGWSTRHLTEEVKKLAPKKRGGRKPIPAVVKIVRVFAKASASAEGLDADEFRLDRAQAKELAADLDESIARLQRLKKALSDT